MAKKVGNNKSGSSDSSSNKQSKRHRYAPQRRKTSCTLARRSSTRSKNRSKQKQRSFSTQNFSSRSKLAGDRSLQMPATIRAREKAPRRRSLALLSGLRTGEGPYSKLLTDYHLDTRTAHKHLGAALRVGAGRRVYASKSDRLMRQLMFPQSSGDVPARIRGSKAASKLSEFLNDRGKLLGHKLSAHDFEAKWRGVRIAGREVFADAATIFLREDFGDLRIDDLYGSVGGAE